MKKTVLVLLLAGVLAAATGGCGKNGTAAGSADPEIPAAEKADGNEFDAYVNLGDYRHLSATKTVYTVTEDTMEHAIHDTLAEYAEYRDVDRAAREGDYVTIRFSGSVNGTTVMDDFADEDYEIILGDAEYGEEFDRQVTGAKPGDSLDFSIAYTAETASESNGMAEFAGETVDYHVDIVSMCEQVLPAYTDGFVKENIEGVSTKKEFEEQLRSQLEADSARESEEELRETLIQQVMDASELKDYPQELYESCYEAALDGYRGIAEAFGQSTEEKDVLEMFGLTRKDLREETMDLLLRTLAVNDIAGKEQISVSDEDFETGAARYAADYEYEDTESFLADYDEDSVRGWILEDKVLDFLAENAEITEKEAVYISEE